LIAQVLSGHGDESSPTRHNEVSQQGLVEDDDLDWEERLQRLWHKVYFKANSRVRKLVDFVHTINLLYIAIVTPLLIGFSIEMTYQINVLESLSLLVSIVWVIVNMRTQAWIKGQPTLKYSTLLKHY
jgi:hypothetical protein